MYNKLLSFYFFLEKKTELSRNLNKKIYRLLCKPWKVAIQYIIVKLLNANKTRIIKRIEPLNDSKELPIISLTTFPKRIDNLWIVLWSIYNQTIRPGKIIITLIKEEFPNGQDSLPTTLKLFLTKGTEVQFHDINLKPHNKYFYTLQQYKNRDIITIDDDLIYYKNTIANLISIQKKWPNCVCANRIQQILSSNNLFLPHKEWPLIYNKIKPSNQYLALGYGGVLYPKNLSYDIFFDIDSIKKLSLNADDLWLKSVEIISKIPVVNGNYYAYPLMIPSSQKISLRHINNNETNPLNDKQWKNLIKFWEISPSTLN
jgi:hypothetical protein